MYNVTDTGDFEQKKVWIRVATPLLFTLILGHVVVDSTIMYPNITSILINFTLMVIVVVAYLYKKDLVKDLLLYVALSLFVSNLVIQDISFVNLSRYIYQLPILFIIVSEKRGTGIISSIVLATYVLISDIKTESTVPEELIHALAFGAIINSVLVTILSKMFYSLIDRTKHYKILSYELKTLNESLAYKSTHDELTGLPKRDVILNKIEACIKRSKEESIYDFAVLFVDLDRFKHINDTLGHHIGDCAIKEQVDKINKIVNTRGIISRFGGDEFIILIEHYENKSEILELVSDLLLEIKNPVLIDGHYIGNTASIGICYANEHYHTPEEYLQYSDLAMYQAKMQGKDRYVVFSEEYKKRNNRYVKLEHDLHQALDHDQLELYYQPIYNMKSDTVTGFEALIRWNHPEFGQVKPSEFIPISEETGQIIEIGKWIMHQACSNLVTLQQELSNETLSMSINISPIQLLNPNIYDQIVEVIEDTGVNPALVSLEITESVVIDEIQHSERLLERIKSLGVKIYVDDFGTGYSSLGYLYQLPLDLIKIDQSFVMMCNDDEKKRAMLKTILLLASEFNMDVIGEGVEKLEEFNELRNLGCNQIQGYYISKPKPMNELKEVLSEIKRKGYHLSI